jgi:hypothetical protein
VLIPREKKGGHGGGPDSLAWMMSYADMATILLAMFIVLSTFAKDQTGISLYYGTGSFRAAVTSFGLPGLMSNSSEVVSLQAPGTQHTLSNTESSEPDREPQSARQKENDNATGKGDTDSPQRVIDAEEENFQRFIGEMDRHFRTAKLPRTSGQTSLDFYDKISSAAPYVTDAQREQIAPLLPLLKRSGYRLQVIVWAGIPRDTATTRAAEEAVNVVEELAAEAGLDAAARRKLVAIGQSWPYRDVARPVMSVVVTRTE